MNGKKIVMCVFWVFLNILNVPGHCIFVFFFNVRSNHSLLHLHYGELRCSDLSTQLLHYGTANGVKLFVTQGAMN